MVATADLWVYNAENFCVSFFNQVTSIFHLRGGKIKKKFWAYLLPIGTYPRVTNVEAVKGSLKKPDDVYEVARSLEAR